MKSSEVWSLQQEGKVLKILKTSTGFRGEKITVSLVFEKQ
jgi:hypothetical protein